MRLTPFATLALLAACATMGGTPAAAPNVGEWPAYGRDAGGARFSPLTQIDARNVARLKPAWTFHTGELGPTFATRRERKFEATPLMVDGSLYLSTPLGRVVALDPETGAMRWSYDAGIDRQANWGDFANRGVSFWRDRRAASGSFCATRIILGAIDGRLIALDAPTGRPCTTFGDGGTVSLRTGLRNTPYELAEYQLTSPPAVLGDLLIAGSSVADNNRTDAASGEVRAYDARTGALRWSWDPVPRDSTDAQWSTWSGPTAHTTGASNAWSVIAVDAELDLVFVPTSSPSPDYWGGERLGDNRYANSIVALRGSTGRVVWHFQTVHHDLWDYDNASPPALVTLRRDGRTIPAILQAAKSGQLFVLNRETGVPVFPVEERAVPASTVSGERASTTQPFNTVIPAISAQRFTAADAWGPTDADRDACRAEIASLRNEGSFTPPSLEGTLVFPSNVGGAHWGGLAVDTTRKIAVIPVNRLAAMVQLIPVERYDAVEARREGSRLDYEYNRMRGTPFYMRRRILTGPSGMPCTPPPFGSLVAIDLTTGALRWDVPLGAIPSGRPDTPPFAGSPNLGGPIATASGIVLIGATFDRAIRAFDIETGREIWKGDLPAGARATPMTYEWKGRQYVVISAGGGDEWGAGDSVVAFALPLTPP